MAIVKASSSDLKVTLTSSDLESAIMKYKKSEKEINAISYLFYNINNITEIYIDTGSSADISIRKGEILYVEMMNQNGLDKASFTITIHDKYWPQKLIFKNFSDYKKDY